MAFVFHQLTGDPQADLVARLSGPPPVVRDAVPLLPGAPSPTGGPSEPGSPWAPPAEFFDADDVFLVVGEPEPERRADVSQPAPLDGGRAISVDLQGSRKAVNTGVSYTDEAAVRDPGPVLPDTSNHSE